MATTIRNLAHRSPYPGLPSTGAPYDLAKDTFELKDMFACLSFPTTRYINSSEILTSSPALNIYVTVLLWVYMFVVQIGMLNLLIAIMTDTYFKVISRPPLPTFPTGG